MSIRCGNRRVHTERTYHETVEGVRACHRGETWACDWLCQKVEHTEDGPVTREFECGSLSWNLPGGRGHTCEGGHEHVYAEFRAAEGWEYAEDEDEARRLAKVGVLPVLT